VGHLGAALAAQGRRVLVVGAGETADGLVEDMIEVLTGMCAGLSGRRSARNRAVMAAKNAGAGGAG
jgi:putative resolvase